MSDKKQRRKLSSWRKSLLMNGGFPDSGTQSAVTQGNDRIAVIEEINKENMVANSYEGGAIFRGPIDTK